MKQKNSKKKIGLSVKKWRDYSYFIYLKWRKKKTCSKEKYKKRINYNKIQKI